MRQVASVIKDGTVRYFLADTEEGELSEFATIAVPANFDPTDAIKLGFNLIGVIGLNGHKHAPAPAPRSVGATIEAAALPASTAQPPRTWIGMPSVIKFVAANPGCRIPDLVKFYRVSDKAVASAVTRAAAAGRIVRDDGALFPAGNGASSIMDTVKAGGPITTKGTPRKRARSERQKWDVSVEQVVEYIRQHPGCGLAEMAMVLLGSDAQPMRQVISNRLNAAAGRADKGQGPRFDKRYVPNPKGGNDMVQYRLVESGLTPMTEMGRDVGLDDDTGDSDAPAGDGEPGLD